MRDASPATLKIVYDLTAYISERLTRFPNVRLHDFCAQKRVTHNLDNYGEMIHHSPAVDLEVLSWLADRSHVLDPPAPTASLQDAGRGVSPRALAHNEFWSERFLSAGSV
jgi:hypothetical protein